MMDHSIVLEVHKPIYETITAKAKGLDGILREIPRHVGDLLAVEIYHMILDA